MPGCRRALRWLGSQLLYRRSQGDCPEPMRTSQRNLHYQLLRSGVLITRSSRAGMPVRLARSFRPRLIRNSSRAAACAPRAATRLPRRRASLRIFVVRCGLPCDPPVGGHSCNGGMIPRFYRAVCEYFTLRSAAGADCNGKIRDYLCRKSVLNGSRASPFQFRRFVGVPTCCRANVAPCSLYLY